MTAAEMNLIIGADVDQAIAALKKLGYQIKQTEQAAGKFAQKGKTDFTAFSQVIQDLPFGFIAIQNNITRLLPAAGGLGLAISALSAAFTFAQVGLSNWTRGFGAAKEEIDAMSKSVAGAQTEIQQVSALLSVARDLTQSTATRNAALEQAIKLQPGYLKGLTLENINSQEAAHATDMLAEALKRKAKVQAISNLLTAANEKLLKAENAQVFESLNAVESFIAKLTRGRGIIGFSALSSDAKAMGENIAEAEAEVKRLETSLKELTTEQAKGNDWKLIKPTTPDKIKKVTEGLKNMGERFAITFGSFEGVRVFDQATIDSIAAGLNKTVNVAVDQAKPGVKVAGKELSDTFGEAFAATINSTIVNAVSVIGETIGNLVTGAKNPFQALFQVIGEGLKALGKQMIQVGLMGKAFQTALKSLLLNPALAIGAGIAAIALGSIISKMGLQTFATGGVVTTPTLALVGEQGPERITPLGYEGTASRAIRVQVEGYISNNVIRLANRRADNAAFNTF